MKLFLCSHFSSVGSLIKEEIENKKVAFIPTASLREGYIGYVGSARKLFKKLGAIVTEIDISTEAYSTIQSVFENADVIYFTGGNSFFLMDQLRKTGADGLLKKELANGKLMIGESAGAIIHHPKVGALRSPKAPRRRAVIFRSHGLLQIKQGTLHFPCAGFRQLPFCGLAIWGHLALQAVPSRQVLQNADLKF